MKKHIAFSETTFRYQLAPVDNIRKQMELNKDISTASKPRRGFGHASVDVKYFVDDIVSVINNINKKGELCSF